MGCNLSIKWTKVINNEILLEILFEIFRLNEIYKNAFSQWNVDRQIGMKSTEQYPLLIGISRHSNGDYLFRYLLNGQTDRPMIDEFLARLIQHRDQFEIGEEQLERVRHTCTSIYLVFYLGKKSST